MARIDRRQPRHRDFIGDIDRMASSQARAEGAGEIVCTPTSIACTRA